MGLGGRGTKSSTEGVARSQKVWKNAEKIKPHQSYSSAWLGCSTCSWKLNEKLRVLKVVTSCFNVIGFLLWMQYFHFPVMFIILMVFPKPVISRIIKIFRWNFQFFILNIVDYVAYQFYLFTISTQKVIKKTKVSGFHWITRYIQLHL